MYKRCFAFILFVTFLISLAGCMSSSGDSSACNGYTPTKYESFFDGNLTVEYGYECDRWEIWIENHTDDYTYTCDTNGYSMVVPPREKRSDFSYSSSVEQSCRMTERRPITYLKSWPVLLNFRVHEGNPEVSVFFMDSVQNREVEFSCKLTFEDGSKPMSFLTPSDLGKWYSLPKSKMDSFYCHIAFW